MDGLENRLVLNRAPEHRGHGHGQRRGESTEQRGELAAVVEERPLDGERFRTSQRLCEPPVDAGTLEGGGVSLWEQVLVRDRPAHLPGDLGR